MVDDVAGRGKDTVGQPVFTKKLPDVFLDVQLRGLGRQGQEGNVVWNDEFLCRVPTGLIEEHDGVGAGSNGAGDFGEMHGHGFDRAAGQDHRRRLALGWTDGPEEVGRGCALVLRRHGAGTAA